MPKMRFLLRWPDGAEDSCSSSSLAIKDVFVPGESYPPAEFLSRSRQALTIMSDRVQACHGRPCSLALDQLPRIEASRNGFADAPESRVTVLSFRE